MFTRRYFGQLALASLPVTGGLYGASKKLSSRIRGVRIGVATYSYNSLPRQGLTDAVIRSMTDTGIGSCLLNPPPTEPAELSEKARPAPAARGPVSAEQAANIEALHHWHLTASLDYYTALRKKFTDAGLTIDMYQPTPLAAPVSDDDLNRACEVTKVLGAPCMAGAFTRSAAKRLAPMAEQHGIKVALQGRPAMTSGDPDAMAKPADFEEAMGYSKNFGSSIDVGDATAAGWDVLRFIQDTHPRVFSLNLKDRTKAGLSVPWGHGDSGIKEILQLIRDKKYPVICFIDCDYTTAEGGSRVADVKRCFGYARAALES